MQEIELGRNDPCHCGSGKKYMHCCRRKDLKAKATRRLAELPKPDSSEPPVSRKPKPPIAPPPTPHQADWDARWEEFEAQDYEGQITLFRQTLKEQGVMDDDLAFEMLTTIYYESVDRNERERFEILVDELRACLPDVYSCGANFYLGYRITNALATGREDTLPALVEEMASTAGNDIDSFNNVLDQLAYHGQLSVLVKAMRSAWPQVGALDDTMIWGIGEFAQRAADYEVFLYLEHHAPSGAPDSKLIEILEYYLQPVPEQLASYMAYLTGQVERRWTMEDFQFKRLDDESNLFCDEEDKESQDIDEAWQNLFNLSVEFLGYARREEGISYPKAELGRKEIHRYVLERHRGDLESLAAPVEPKKRTTKRKRRRRSHKPDHLLCPDRATLDHFLSNLLVFFNPQRYKAAATLELVPMWLRFLESRQLIDDEQRAKTMSDLRGLDTELRKVWEKSASDPALLQGLEGWRDE